MIIASMLSIPGLAVEGPDARRYLHSQLSNDIAALPVGASCYSLLLEPVGKLVSLFRVVCVSEETFLIEFDGPVAADVVQATQTRLQRFLIRTKATITELSTSVTRIRSTDERTMRKRVNRATTHRPLVRHGGVTAPLSTSSVAMRASSVLLMRSSSSIRTASKPNAFVSDGRRTAAKSSWVRPFPHRSASCDRR